MTKSMLQELTDQPDEKIYGDMKRVVPFTALAIFAMIRGRFITWFDAIC